MIIKILYFLIFSILLIDSAIASKIEQGLEINTTVVNSCIVSANNLNFGKYNSASDIASTTISVKCTKGTPYSIGLNKGDTSINLLNGRQMKNKTSILKYNLYQDPEKKRIWGDTVNNILVGDGNGENQYYTIYGQIPANQVVPSGDYFDIIHLTLSWGSSNPTQASKQGISNYQISLRMKISSQK